MLISSDVVTLSVLKRFRSICCQQDNNADPLGGADAGFVGNTVGFVHSSYRFDESILFVYSSVRLGCAERMKMIKLLLAIWAVLGVGYFVWDTVQFEHRWSRNEGTDYRILAAGPLLWTLYGSVYGCSLLVQYCSSSEVPVQEVMMDLDRVDLCVN